jgi:hypothetical protein
MIENLRELSAAAQGEVDDAEGQRRRDLDSASSWIARAFIWKTEQDKKKKEKN